MNSVLNSPFPLIAALLRGGALVTVLLWSAMSFLPVARLLYGDLSAVQLAAQLFFFATGVAGVITLYALLLFVATDTTRRAVTAVSHRSLDVAGAYTALWILLYSWAG